MCVSHISKFIDKSQYVNEGEVISDIYRITTPKTENSCRNILIHISLIKYLKELKEKYNTKFV